MIAILKYIVAFLVNPIQLIGLAVVMSLILRKRKPKTAQKLLIISFIWLFITGTKYIPDVMVHQLEKQYSVLIPDSCMQDIPIMVLGGGGINDLAIPAQDRLSHTSLARMSEGIRLCHHLNAPFIVFSGYSSTGSTSQAMITKLAAIDLGVQSEFIKILEVPSTTEEEALAYKNTFGTQYSELILVTSDIHMPRAMSLFHKHGLNPIAAPTDHILKKQYGSISNIANTFDNGWKITDKIWPWQSNRQNFEKFSAAMHEYIGLLLATFS